MKKLLLALFKPRPKVVLRCAVCGCQSPGCRDHADATEQHWARVNAFGEVSYVDPETGDEYDEPSLDTIVYE